MKSKLHHMGHRIHPQEAAEALYKMDTEAAKIIHAAFTEESGAEPNFRVHERAYHDFAATGYTVSDLRIVMQHIKSENKKMNGAKHSLRLDRLLDFDYRRFDSLLTEAKAIRRNRIPKPTEKAKTLAAWRGCEPVENGNVRHISGVFKNLGNQ